MREVILRFQGLKFIVPKETECFWPYYGICFVGEYDPILSHISGSDVVIDAGANIGIFILLASRKARKVIAVEPDPKNFSYLVRNVKLNNAENVILVNEALSDYVGEGHISGKGLSAALSPNKGTAVKVTTIDAMLRRLCVTKVDVVKMDVEGEEVKSLQGEYLSKVKEVMVEVHNANADKMIRSILETHGFAVSEWRFSLLKTLKKIFTNFMPFIDAESRNGFVALKYILGLSNHPVPAAERTSGIKLLYAVRLT
jgi:FkbM family methyltransferase